MNTWKITVLLLLCSGCTVVGPNYIPPEPIIPEQWQCNACSEEELSFAWWLALDDPLLTRYMEDALCNRDLLAAEAAILQARAIRKITASQLFPQVNLDLSASRTYFSKNGPLFAIDAFSTSNTPGMPFDIQIPQIQNIYTALIDVSWEIDLFGKTRRQIEGAVATIGSMIAKRDGILISTRAEIAKNYIALRTVQQQGLLLEERLSLLEKEENIATKRTTKGLTNRLNVENIRSEIETIKAKLPQIVVSIYQSIYAISVLTGRLPECLMQELCTIEPLPMAPGEITCGLRSDLLRRRPDVRQKERALAASIAQIGVAVASFFPSFTLGLDLGLQSILLSNLFEANSTTWSIGGLSVIPLFQGGNLVGNLRLSEAQAMSAAFAYQQTVLTSLKEAESALIAYRQEEARVGSLQRAMSHDLAYDRLTQTRYEKGLTSISEWIQSQEKVNQTKQALLEGEAALLQDLITLYQSLGAGWEDTPI